MTKLLSYKYINLLGRILIGVFAIWIIFVKLQESIINNVDTHHLHVQYKYIVFTLILMSFNWGVEALKWKFTIRSIQQINLFTAFKLTITGITIGLITPNRIGEIPGRALLLQNKNKLKDLVVLTSVGAFSQLLITFLFGTVAAYFTLTFVNFPVDFRFIIVILFSTTVILFIIYFFNKGLKNLFYKIPFIKQKKLLDALELFSFNELLIILMLSAVRYIVFSFQYYLVLTAFGIEINSITDMLLIPLCFLITSAIPTILISEIGVRGSVALFVLGIISNLNLEILTASIVLWLINVAFPALMGLLFINRLKIVKEA